MKTINQTAQESESKAIYRAPRLVALGTAEGLVQLGMLGNVFDSMSGNGRETKR
jgi:hypothetical protein